MSEMSFSEYAESLGADRARIEELKCEMIAAVEEQRLKEIRKSLGLTQGQLASSAGISQNRVSDIENGRTSSLRIGTLARYADALGCDIEVLLRPRPGNDGAAPRPALKIAIG